MQKVLGGEVPYPPENADDEADEEFDPDEDYGHIK